MTEKRKIYLYDADTVFKTLKDICNKSSFSVKEVDDSIRRIIISTSPSLFSYGERVEVIVQPKGIDESLVFVKAEPKAFFNITAGGSVERVIQKIYQKLDEELS